MNDDDRLKELLDSAAPDQPDLPPAARTSAVRDRAVVVRRRHRLVLAAAVVAAVGVGVGVPVLTSGDNPDGASQVAGDPTPTTTAPAACPADPIDVSEGVGADSLPDGAVSARACPATFGGAGTAPGPTDDLPTEPVVEGLDRFTSEVRALAAYRSPDDCALISVAPTPWAIVVSYPDGTSATLGSATTICSSVPVEGVDRDVDAIRSLFGSVAQGGGEEPTADPTDGIGQGVDLTCPESPADLDAVLTDPDTFTGDLTGFEAVAGNVCYVPDPMGAPEYADTGRVLSPDEAAILAADLAARSTSTPTLAGRCTDSGPTRVVVLVDADGLGVTRVDRSCTTEFAGAGSYWVAGDEAEDVIDRALGGRVGG